MSVAVSENTVYIYSITDSLLASDAFPSPRTWLDYPNTLSYDYAYTIGSFEACQALPGAVLAADGSVTLTNTFTVNGSATCSADVVCHPLPLGGATRTMGFFKTHLLALTDCLAAWNGSIPLGYANVTTVPEALGLLWANPAAYAGLDKARLLLGRQVLVAECNQRLFGAVPDFGDAVSVLAGDSCSEMQSLAVAVDAFNNSNDTVAFPVTFTPGAADPGDAKQLAASSPATFPPGSCAP